MHLSVFDSRFIEIVSARVKFDVLGDHFVFTKGQIWHPSQRSGIFSDIPTSRAHVWTEHGGISLYREATHKANGMAYDGSGQILVCEYATNSVNRIDAIGNGVTLIDSYRGAALDSPNDVGLGPAGSIYFADPDFGRKDSPWGVPRDRELSFCDPYRIAPYGTQSLLAFDFDSPNGLCFSPDFRRLYVNDSNNLHIRVFDISSDGTLTGGDVWKNVVGDGEGVPDGMKVDSQGNVYCAGPDGIHGFADDGWVLGVIHTPAYSANFCFGGPDMCTLFVTCENMFIRTQVQTPGFSNLMEAA